MEQRTHHIPRVTSTQEEARKRLAEGRATQGDMILADEQTEGRGRFGRTWISPKGGLYATIILSLDPLLSLKAGLAITRVLRSAGIEAGIKWPNDVYVRDLKIAGVLIETTGGVALAGIGLNLVASPLETSTCVHQYVEGISRDAWAHRIAHELMDLSRGHLDLSEYRGACLTLGCRVRMDGIGEGSTIEGIALDIDDAGHLIIETELGRRVITSGECWHLRN